jgi:hypothetical protein
MSLVIHLLGRPRIERDGEPLATPRGHKAWGLVAHGAYFLITGVAPFVSRRAFEAVTGSKREWWLVQTVGVLTSSVGLGLLVATARDRVTPELAAVAIGSSLGLGGIDVVYVVRGRISAVYLVDAAVQAALIAALARWATVRPSQG